MARDRLHDMAITKWTPYHYAKSLQCDEIKKFWLLIFNFVVIKLKSIKEWWVPFKISFNYTKYLAPIYNYTLAQQQQA